MNRLTALLILGLAGFSTLVVLLLAEVTGAQIVPGVDLVDVKTLEHGVPAQPLPVIRHEETGNIVPQVDIRETLVRRPYRLSDGSQWAEERCDCGKACCDE